MKNKILVLILICISIMTLSACKSNTPAEDNKFAHISNATVGKSIFVHSSDIAFFGYENLLCTAKFQSGSLSEFVIEGGFTGKIYALAVYDNNLFVSASDGIFKYDLSMFEGKSKAKPVVLWDNNLSEFNVFEIYDNKLFFIYGTTLCYIPTDGGNKTDVTTETVDFEITTDGIYYVKKDGALHLLSLDLTSDETLTNLPAETKIQLIDGKLYYKDGVQLKAFDLKEKKLIDIKTDNEVNEYLQCVWSNGENLLYRTQDFKEKLITKDGEKDIDDDVRYPDKAYAYVYKDCLLRSKNNSIRITDLTNGTIRDYDLEQELQSMLSQLTNKQSTPTQENNKLSSSSSEYDILEGLQIQRDGSALYMYGNDFLLSMPIDDDWEYVQNDKDSFSIIYIPGKNAGYGGHLVTIKAYDSNDTSYTNFPSYRVAGRSKNTNKVFVAIFPTDVQYDSNNKSQAARYQDLFEYVKKIDENAVNSPFQTADSD